MFVQPIQPQSAGAREGCRARSEPSAVLLADGDRDVHAIFGTALEREGFRVIHAFSADECLRVALARRVCAALVSVGGCGLLTWRRLHDLATAGAAADRGFAIICLTTDPRLSPGMRGRPPHGAAAVLMLPCSPALLAAEVRRAVRDRGVQPN